MNPDCREKEPHGCSNPVTFMPLLRTGLSGPRAHYANMWRAYDLRKLRALYVQLHQTAHDKTYDTHIHGQEKRYSSVTLKFKSENLPLNNAY